MKYLGKIIGTGILICILINCKPDIKSKGGFCYMKDTLVSDMNGFRKDSNSFYNPVYLIKDSTKIKVEIDSIHYLLASLVYSYFNEPIYYNYYLGEVKFRLLEIPSLYPNPYLITIFKHKNKYYIQGKLQKNHTKYFFRTLEKMSDKNSVGYFKEPVIKVLNKVKNVSRFTVKDTIKRISDKEWSRFIQLLDSTNFWNTKPYENHGPKIDGSSWVLEGHEENRYWYVMDECSEACEYLSKLSPIADDILRYR